MGGLMAKFRSEQANAQKPLPAARQLPEWLLKMQTRVQGTEMGTVRRCGPFVDAMKVGWLMPLPHGMFAKVSDLQAEIRMVYDPSGIALQTHSVQQIPSHMGQPIKINSPWHLELPEGWSGLVVPPLNREPFPLRPVAGIVDWDTYPEAINLPCEWDHDRFPEWDGPLPGGEPFAQIIPFRHDTWQTSYAEGVGDIEDGIEEFRERQQQDPGAYRRWYRKAKS